MRILLITLCLGILTACTNPPINPYHLEDIKVGQSRDHVLAQVRQKPDKVVHTTFNGDDIIAYYYHLQTGTRTSTVCSAPAICRQVKEPVSIPYLFIFKNANQPRLAYYGTVEKMKKSIDPAQRSLVKQIQIVSTKPRTGGK